MRSAKICIVGDFAVGKTSTVARFVHNVFSEKYLTTVGVKIDIKELDTESAGPMKLVIWDIAGADEFGEVEYAYLRGAAGVLLVADGTRASTVDAAIGLLEEVRKRYGAIHFVALLNKSDLESEWEVGQDEIESSAGRGVHWIRCSAKTGQSVDEAIRSLAEAIAGDAGGRP